MDITKRGHLAGLLIGGLLLGCGSSTPSTGTDAGNPVADSGTAVDTGTDAAPPSDHPGTDGSSGDASTIPRQCVSPMAITGTPGTDGAIHILGNNGTAPDTLIGNLPASCTGGTQAATVVYTYTMRSTAYLVASTDYTGSAMALDTILAILPTCSVSAVPIACNDDNGFDGNYLSTAATAAPVPMGTTVYIVVAGYSGAGVMTGAFNLGVKEVTGTAVGTTCGEFDACVTNSDCLSSMTDATHYVCVAEGAQGGYCTGTAGTTCNAGLTCSSSSQTCVAMAASGASCDAAGEYYACTAGSSCSPLPTATNHMAYACVPDGTAGGQCHATPPECTNPAQCAPGNVCQNSIAPGGTCDLLGGTTNCTMNAVCAPMSATVATCLATTATPTGSHATPATAVAPVTHTTVYTGTLASATDVVCYGVTVPMGGSIYTETHQPGGPNCDPMGADTLLTVYNPAGMSIAQNNVESPSSICSRIDPAVTATAHGLAAGTYAVCVGTTTGPATMGASITYSVTLGIE